MASTLTRRSFLERAALASAALAFAGRPARAAGGMYVSMNGALTSGKNVAWPDFARLAAKTGYGGVDWSLGPVKTAGLDASKALFAELKLRPTIVNLPVQGPFAGDDTAFQTAIAKLGDDCEFAAALGCKKMMFVLQPTTTLSKEDQRKLVRDRVSAIAAIMQKSKLSLGMEFLGPLYMRTRPNTNPFIWKMDEAVDLAKDCGPNVGVILDAWHWHHSGSTVNDILSAGRSRVIHVHVSDAKEMAPEDVRDNMRLMPGEGIINLTGFFQALTKIGYDDGVSPEPLGRVPPEMTADDAAKLGLDTTTAVMKKAGVTVIS